MQVSTVSSRLKANQNCCDLLRSRLQGSPGIYKVTAHMPCTEIRSNLNDARKWTGTARDKKKKNPPYVVIRKITMDLQTYNWQNVRTKYRLKTQNAPVEKKVGVLCLLWFIGHWSNDAVVTFMICSHQARLEIVFSLRQCSKANWISGKENKTIEAISRQHQSKKKYNFATLESRIYIFLNKLSYPLSNSGFVNELWMQDFLYLQSYNPDLMASYKLVSAMRWLVSMLTHTR